LALDQGTTSSRAILFNLRGQVVSMAQQEFTQHFPKPGWVEHDADEIWRSQLATARSAMRKAKLKAGDIAAIGITNQRETTMIWDKVTGEPVHHAIVWQDRRTAPLCEKLQKAGHAEMVRQKTGLVIDAYFSGTKIAWLLNQVPGLKKKAKTGQLAFGTMDSWLLWKLTEGRVHATDVTNASRTLLMNLQSCQWDEEMLGLLGVPAALLPEIRPSSAVYGHTTLLGGSIPICGMAGDQHAALFGQRCIEPGMAKNTYGTGCFMLMNTGKKPIASENRLLTTLAWQLEGQEPEYALEGSIFVAGAIVQWLRDGLGIIKKASDIEALAQQVESSEGVFLVPALAGLGAPHWDPYARGTLIGLTRGSTRAHIARAALEGIAFQVADILQAMEKDAGIRLRQLRVDGGASVNRLLMQFQADVLGVPVMRPKVTETTALGAAVLAGLASGCWSSPAALERMWNADAEFKPQMKAAQMKPHYQQWLRAVERSKGWAE
jgi:glycerol kinase